MNTISCDSTFSSKLVKKRNTQRKRKKEGSFFPRAQSMEDNGTSCYNFTTNQRMIIGLSEILASSLTILACLFVIVIIVAYKKYTFTFQMLVLCLAVSFIVDAVVHVVTGASYQVITTSTGYCQALAFFKQYSAICIILSLICIITELCLSILMKRDTHRLRWVYVAVICLIPATTSWIPLASNRYGLSATICTIQTYNAETCQPDLLGIILLILLWWVPYGITFIVTGPVYIFILYRISREQKRYVGVVDINRSTVYQQTVKEVGYIKWLPFCIFVFNLIGIAAGGLALSFHSINVGLWIVGTVVKGLQGLIIAIPVAVHPSTRRILSWKGFVVACRQNVLRRGKEAIEEYPIRKEFSDSVSVSDYHKM